MSWRLVLRCLQFHVRHEMGFGNVILMLCAEVGCGTSGVGGGLLEKP